MSLLDDFDLFSPTMANPAAPDPRRCLHPRVLRESVALPGQEAFGVRCGRCGKMLDAAASRRGRNNRSRGNRAELDIARSVGGRKMGPLGMPWDVEIPGYARFQVKKLARWPSLAACLAWLDTIPAGRELRGVAVVETGRKPRRLLVVDLDEFAAWHGEVSTDDPPPPDPLQLEQTGA